MQEKLFFKSSSGVKLCGILSNPTNDISKPIIVLTHGFSVNKNSFTNQALEKILNEKGISTFRFDFFGHGESEGKFEEITVSKGVEDTVSAVTFLKKKKYTKIGLLGSSYGGTCIIIAASKLKNLFVLALKSSVSDYYEVEAGRMSKKDISDWKKNKHIIYDKEKNLKLNYSFYEDILKLNIYKDAKKIKIPTIIVHGDKDAEVPLKQSIELVKHIKTSKLVIIKGGDHRYSNKRDFDIVMKLLSDFILDNSKN